jgi:hypothetical protein
MSPELEAKIITKYPKMFPGADGSRLAIDMFGIETGDGWYTLIDTLCSDIQGMIDNSQDRENPITQVVLIQVKEKFGTLRFYYSGGNDLIRGMAWFAESMSEHICETCGKPGVLRGGGWLVTACDEHSRGKLPMSEVKNTF